MKSIPFISPCSLARQHQGGGEAESKCEVEGEVEGAAESVVDVVKEDIPGVSPSRVSHSRSHSTTPSFGTADNFSITG